MDFETRVQREAVQSSPHCYCSRYCCHCLMLKMRKKRLKMMMKRRVPT
jgi:hypothetical protein